MCACCAGIGWLVIAHAGDVLVVDRDARPTPLAPVVGVAPSVQLHGTALDGGGNVTPLRTPGGPTSGGPTG